MAQFRFWVAVLLTVSGLSPQGDSTARPEPVVDNGEFMDMFLNRVFARDAPTVKP
jgi:hypothetical protein